MSVLQQTGVTPPRGQDRGTALSGGGQVGMGGTRDRVGMGGIGDRVGKGQHQGGTGDRVGKGLPWGDTRTRGATGGPGMGVALGQPQGQNGQRLALGWCGTGTGMAQGGTGMAQDWQRWPECHEDCGRCRQAVMVVASPTLGVVAGLSAGAPVPRARAAAPGVSRRFGDSRERRRCPPGDATSAAGPEPRQPPWRRRQGGCVRAPG